MFQVQVLLVVLLWALILHEVFTQNERRLDLHSFCTIPGGFNLWHDIARVYVFSDHQKKTYLI